MKQMDELYKKEKERLINETMELWETNASRYRILPIKYKFLLGMRLYARNNVPGYKSEKVKSIPEKILEDYPTIEFLRITDKICAKEYLEDKCYLAILRIKEQVSNLRYDYVANTINSMVADYSLWWNRVMNPPSNLAQSPESCKNGRHTSHYGYNAGDSHHL